MVHNTIRRFEIAIERGRNPEPYCQYLPVEPRLLGRDRGRRGDLYGAQPPRESPRSHRWGGCDPPGSWLPTFRLVSLNHPCDLRQRGSLRLRGWDGAVPMLTGVVPRAVPDNGQGQGPGARLWSSEYTHQLLELSLNGARGGRCRGHRLPSLGLPRRQRFDEHHTDAKHGRRVAGGDLKGMQRPHSG